MALRDIDSSQPTIISVPALGSAHSIGVQSLDAHDQSRSFRFRCTCRCRDQKSALRPVARFSRDLFAEQRQHVLSCYEPEAWDQARKKTITFLAWKQLQAASQILFTMSFIKNNV